ncbi:Isocitrate dehydrogenase (NAD(+)) [Candidatus Omnitrophus magneticus]|uniref:Isocitrate dehydrogenase (NAD(+)) n=1 Tax=Candidatus Omnitrophus magneticus TaxID=1609969 RepID=A0A0F0CKE7_9BACT|nr:Isocitrate dehydrogenase (NAD(+)) [Candidatus Omnitrophus magneticus]
METINSYQNQIIENAKNHFEKIVKEQLARVEEMKKGVEWIDYSKLKPIIIGICWGDGIGMRISKDAERVLKYMLEEELAAGCVEFRTISGLTIENRAKQKKAIPEDVLEEIKKCHVVLKGPTTTPQAGDKWPNIESANVAMRRELDLFANVRPVKVPEQGINWIFFRENTEGAYILGSRGIDVTNDLSIDFKVITEQGSDRIIRMAFEYAKNNGLKRVTAVTKSNVVKTTDGRFSRAAKRIAVEYKQYGIEQDEWYVDIMSAKLIDPLRRGDFQVIVLPPLYGDILTADAAKLQGGVGTAGSANIGKRYAMFEAIHGSAPRMVDEGRDIYADPSSMIRAASMLLRHIGFSERAESVDMALEICGQFEKKLTITGRNTGATGAEFTSYLLDWINNPSLKKEWKNFSQKFKK